MRCGGTGSPGDCQCSDCNCTGKSNCTCLGCIAKSEHKKELAVLRAELGIVTADRNGVKQTNDRLRAEVERLREALEFARDLSYVGELSKKDANSALCGIYNASIRALATKGETV